MFHFVKRDENAKNFCSDRDIVCHTCIDIMVVWSVLLMSKLRTKVRLVVGSGGGVNPIQSGVSGVVIINGV